MALVDVDHFVAVVRFGAVASVGAADGLDDLVSVEAILIELGGENKIAILVRSREIDVLRILVIDHVERQARDFILQFLHLREEWPAEIHLPPEVLRIPIIRPPALRAINGKCAPLRIHGHDRSFATVTRTTVETAFVAPEETALLPAVGAECRRRNRAFLPAENGRNFVEELHVIGRDIKGGLAP